MFDDPKKELEELQEKLLQDEDWFEKELDSAKRMIGQVPEKDRAAPKAKNKRAVREASAGKTAAAPVMDDTQVWSRELSFEQEEPKPKEKGIRNLLIIAALETLGIALVGAYWALFLLK